MKIRKSILSLAGAAALVIGTAAPALAMNVSPEPEQPHVAGELIATVNAPMVPLCDRLTEDATAYILENDLQLCGFNQSSTGGVTTYGSASGLCGNSALYLYNGNFAGQARISYGFTSTAGTIVVRSLVVDWDGATTDGSYTDFTAMSAVGYNNNIYRTTGVGYAAADLQGTVLTNWGLWCVVGSPFDYKYIS